jgi:hypothetical protein
LVYGKEIEHSTAQNSAKRRAQGFFKQGLIRGCIKRLRYAAKDTAPFL